MFSPRHLYHWHIVKSINNTCSIIMLLFPSQNCLKLQTLFKESPKVYHLLFLQDNIFCSFFLLLTPLFALFVLDFSYNLPNIWAAQNKSFHLHPIPLFQLRKIGKFINRYTAKIFARSCTMLATYKAKMFVKFNYQEEEHKRLYFTIFSILNIHYRN